MTKFIFTVTLQAHGNTGEEAWIRAIEGFIEDPGDPDSVEIIEEDDDEED